MDAIAGVTGEAGTIELRRRRVVARYGIAFLSGYNSGMNLSKKLLLKVFAAFALGLSAMPAMADEAYAPPQDDPSGMASFRGSEAQSNEKKPVRVFILGIDGKKVAGEVAGWDTPLAVAPGRHIVAVGVKDLYEEFEVDACAGCAFTAHATHMVESRGMVKIANTELWIIKEPDSQVVTEKKAAKPRPRNVKVRVGF